MDFHCKSIFGFINDNIQNYVKRLAEFVAIKSISRFADNRNDCNLAIDYVASFLKQLGAEVEKNHMGYEKMSDGKKLPLPPIILATLGRSLQKRTLLIYGHVDVCEAYDKDWSSDPFVLTKCAEFLYGRGASDNKGPLLAWLIAVECFQKLNIVIPVNLKFVIEGMEESGSQGLGDLLCEKKIKFLNDVDYVAVSDNFWLTPTVPCVSYGVRGLIYFYVRLAGSNRTLHSGVHGGAIDEAMDDCLYLMKSLTDDRGKLIVPGLFDDVNDISREEMEQYSNLEFTIQEYCDSIGVRNTKFPDKAEVLKARWSQPSVCYHGIHGAFNELVGDTKIPRHVVGKFSLRLVNSQKPKRIAELVKDYLISKFQLRQSACHLVVDAFCECQPWSTDPHTTYFKCAKNAVERVWKRQPDLNKEGASIPVMYLLQKIVDREMLMLPISSSDDSPHEPNERIRLENYIQGIKVMASFFFEVADMPDERLVAMAIENESKDDTFTQI